MRCATDPVESRFGFRDLWLDSLYVAGTRESRLLNPRHLLASGGRISTLGGDHGATTHFKRHNLGTYRWLLSCGEGWFVCARFGNDRDWSRWQDRGCWRCVCPVDTDVEEYRKRAEEGRRQHEGRRAHPHLRG